MIHIKVPATSANMGSGFDSIGVALQLYNHIWIEEIEGEGKLHIEVKRQQEIEIPTDKENLIYQTIADFYDRIGKKLPSLHIIQEDFIPMARGLGSSAACIVGALFAGNALAGNPYDKEELAKIASEIEGHPDNAVPAVFGNMVVGVQNFSDLKYVTVEVPEELIFGTLVPNFPVATKDARSVLPDTYSRKDMVFNSSRSALLVASMFTKNFDNLAVAMDDKIHQPYRRKLIPNMDNVLGHGMKFGALASYLSGAGSTLMAVVHENIEVEFKKNMEDYLKTIPDGWKLDMLKVDKSGVIVEEV